MRTKIVATLGPATDSPERIRALIEHGVDVFRFNFSHGTHDDHAAHMKRLREAADDLGANVCVLQDLQGPKIRTGRLKDGGPVHLDAGQPVAITTRSVVGDAQQLATSYRGLPKDVSAGDTILLDDGRIELRVTDVEPDTVRCEIVVGGSIGQHKGINLPGVDVSAPPLTRKDRQDLAFGLDLGADAVALSFVRRARDIQALRRAIEKHGSDAPVIAKIEKPEAVRELDAILDAADGVMVARGDLGVEMSPEQVPVLQKRIIRKANRRGKPVITATQMLESMIRQPLPTRAEASDVANAIFDGTDAVMLSGETAVGHYPLESVQMMTRIALAAEEVFQPSERTGTTAAPESQAHAQPRPVPSAIADAAVRVARDVRAAALVVFTVSGATARLLAQRRPVTPIHAFSPKEQICRRLALAWGVEAHPLPLAEATDRLIADAEAELKRIEEVRQGDTIVLVAGETPLPGATDVLKVLRVE